MVPYNQELASIVYMKGRYWLNYEVDDIVHENKFADRTFHVLGKGVKNKHGFRVSSSPAGLPVQDW